MKKRIPTIYVYGEINNASFISFSKKLSFIEKSNSTEARMILISEGGEAFSALAFFDRIQKSPVKVTAVATGLVASAATLVFMACDTRLMTYNAWFMVHEDTSVDDSPRKTWEREKEAIFARRLEHQWSSLFASVSSIKKEEWDKLNKEETYLSAEECEKLGIAKRIL